ncbi:hypothetical protein [Stenotrophomonas sp. NA06056]|uniref:hypothetical protein n=1 Tax=Stenotrophomonas sp. NA06056 TaxID=2742129 RepID=UPI00158BC0CF|nr:hypothetical protein [Stenotrophomonas sp. NA06056]QKW56796.1 hypothetical protein HUT07_09265 [Stenotrophomonas sp. NA06056]
MNQQKLGSERISLMRSAVIALAIVLLVVVVVGWSVPGGLEVFDEPGSAADWLAAVGTWMIGFGATKFAANDYQLKLHERRERLLQDAEKRLSALQVKVASIRNWSHQLQMAGQFFADYPMESASPKYIEEMLEGTKRALLSIPWASEDAIDMGSEEIRALERTTRDMDTAVVLVTTTLEICSGESAVSALPHHGETLKTLGGLLVRVADPMASLAAYLDAEATETRHSRARIIRKLRREADALLNG